eukprot:COSAG01_NODE_3301_length_6295_cov_20.275823_2_plen_77_part_00
MTEAGLLTAHASSMTGCSSSGTLELVFLEVNSLSNTVGPLRFCEEKRSCQLSGVTILRAHRSSGWLPASLTIAEPL